MPSSPEGEFLRTPTREQRFIELHERHCEAIRRYAYRRSPGLADDIVSETFLVAWRRLDVIPADERPWLFGVARKVRLNLERSSRRQTAVSERMMRAAAASALGEAETSSTAVEVALSKLSERDREILLLHVWEELDRREIASVLSTSVANVSVRLHRARARFAEALSAQARDANGLVPSMTGGASDVV
jgi:RNA polymerase sigma factor (sigma-70 family)